MCDDMVIGPCFVFCVLYFCNNHAEIIGDVVVKKVFIDTYNFILACNAFKGGNRLHKN